MKCFRKQGGRKGMGRKGNTEIIDSFSCTKQSAVRSIIRCVIIAWFRAVCTAMAVFLLIMNMGYHSISEAGNTKASSRQGACSESESSSECKSKDQSEPASGDGMRNQSESSSGGGSGNQSESSSGGGSEEQSESSSEGGSEEQSESSSEGGSEEQSESSSESGSAQESEVPSERESGSEREPSTESGKIQESETERPKWPRRDYLVSIQDVAVSLPDGGRVYDGTDRIEITFRTMIRPLPGETGAADRALSKPSEGGSAGGAASEHDRPDSPDQEENVPAYTVAGSAHLDSPDAGKRKVVCSFLLYTESPDHVRLDEKTTSPDLWVNVKKAPLRIRIPDGTKRYGDPADLEHIRMEEDGCIEVHGFVRDSSGQEIVPQGFEMPVLDVDPTVLEQWSPIYDTQEQLKTGKIKTRKYKHALILKRDGSGRIMGSATDNYEFCCDPGSQGLTGGCVRIERAPIQSGIHFEVKGEEGACRKEGEDAWIVRAGSSLYAGPLPGQGYNTGKREINISQDGSFVFHLEKRGKDGTLAADSLDAAVSYRVDGSAPKADTSVNGIRQEGGMMFGRAGASVLIMAGEDEISGLESVRYRVLSGPVSRENVHQAMRGTSWMTSVSEWKNIPQNVKVGLSDTGICQVEVETRDLVGNTQLSQSPVFVLDSDAPRITVSGVEEGSANASSLRIRVQCEDPCFLTGSLSAELLAEDGGIIPNARKTEESEDGETLIFDDFPRQKEADAVYRLIVSASDRAGNTAKKQVSFSVNRFGSSYALSEATRGKLKDYYHTRPFDVTFLETNLSQVPSARVLLRCGEHLKELRQGAGLAVNLDRNEKGTARYSYTVPASCFEKDGVYEVMLLTTDQAGNSSDSLAQRLPVRFAIDRTEPECLVSGIQAEGRYQEKEVTAVIEVRDNLALDEAEIYVDAMSLGKWKAPQLEEGNGIIKLKLPEKDAWQTVQVHVRDKAGNETWSAEIPVYISSEDPQEAEDYRKVRLSAQQMADVRVGMARILDQARESKWFAAWYPILTGNMQQLKTSWAPPGGSSIRTVRAEAARAQPSTLQAQQGEKNDRKSGNVRQEGNNRIGRILAGIAAAAILVLALGLFFLYRYRRRQAQARHRKGGWIE